MSVGDTAWVGDTTTVHVGVGLGAREGVEVGPTPVISSNPHLFEDRIAVTFGNYKFIRWLTSERRELYDLSADPDEAQSLINTLPDIALQAEAILDEHLVRSLMWVESLGLDEGRAKAQLDPVTQERLKALGYLQ